MKKKAGSAFGTGRPSTGRTHAITIRISENAFEYLDRVGSKSAYIDSLIVSRAEENNPLTTNTSS